MGQRANLIILQNASYELYYSHWCANTLPTDLFWGEQHATSFIEMQTRVDESGWLDTIWAEGGAILDLDKKKLLFYGGEDILCDIPLRNLYLKLMREVWPGWEIEWAYEGILDLANYVGYPKENVLTITDDDRNDARLLPPEEKDWVDTIASVKFSPDELLLFPLCGGIDVYVTHGPELIDKIDKSNGYKTLALDEWTNTYPTGGFHIDVLSRRVEVWHANDCPNLIDKLQSQWSGWQVIELYGHYEAQGERTHGRLFFQERSQHQLLEELRGILVREPSSNPLDALSTFVKKEADAGRKAEINPYALRYDRYELPKNKKEEILSNAIAKGINPIE
ncbi:hypothetical protein [Gorillibacterium sp. CAU 1737]|uniref:hypothetical protein n=1 Tax=Gorillibacterium sp. CAU 1737 TaxID=3140362 RepID=UPI003260E791